MTVTRSPQGKFASPPPRMSIEEAKYLAGRIPENWSPYGYPEAVRRLYDAGLCLMAQRRGRTADGKTGAMEGIWKKAKTTNGVRR